MRLTGIVKIGGALGNDPRPLLDDLCDRVARGERWALVHGASAMMAISRFFTKRIIRVLSYLSVSWPEVAENSKNGRMNSAPITSPAMAGGSHDTLSW